MRLGSSIAMIAVGLILALAVPYDLGAINLQLVGWILAAVGVIGLIATVAISRRSVGTQREVYHPTTGCDHPAAAAPYPLIAA